MKQPAVSVELLQWVEQVFPDRCPSEADTDREVWMAVGAQRVVKKLRQVHRDQLKRDLASGGA